MRLNSIRSKLIVVLILALAGMLFLSITSLSTERRTLIDDRKVKTQHLVQAAHSLVAHFHQRQQSGEMSEATAQAAAIAALKAMRYGGNEYFWVNDMHPTVIMHPIKPELDGKDVSQTKDPNGLFLFKEFVNVAQREGAGFVAYYWPKPGQEKPVAKISYVTSFAPWGWVIGSGIYIDDVDAIFAEHAATTIAIDGVLFVLIGALLFSLMRSIAKPIQEMRQSMRDIQTTRNLSLRVRADGNQETNEIAAAFNDMVGSFQELIRQVIASSNEVEALALRLSGSATTVARESADQCDASSSMAGAMEEMQANITQVAASSAEAHRIAEESGTYSDEGRSVVEGAANEMTRIASAVTDSSAHIRKLGEMSLQITSIVNVIKDIADQTNLLALNAAIEAARAGEQGRGFAVVADEVRKLAERTTKSTLEISGMISNVQSGTEEAVRSMEEGSARVEQGVALARNAGQSMDHIRSGAERVVSVVGEIAIALREQTLAAQHVADSVSRIVTMAEQNSQETEVIAQSAGSLEQLSRELQATVSSFRV